jgi:hypothetical protein
MHSELPYCANNGIFVSDWMNSKKHSKILLEEVPRLGSTLKELWPTSIHTQKLKNLYLSNSIYINGIDVRPFLISYSWELIYEAKVEDMSLQKYFSLIDDFFKIKHHYFIKDLENVYTKEFLNRSQLGNHFLRLKNEVLKYIRENKNILNQPISFIYKNNKILLEKINEFISNIMEWYIVAKIIKNDNNNFIVHAGLLHTSNLNNLLINEYNYKLVSYEGINTIEEGYKKSNGCLTLSSKINNMFGGYTTTASSGS